MTAGDADRPGLESRVARHRVPLLAAAVLGLTALAWHNRFVQDDAFITFQYARHLAEGAGLTWNAGERVEGYTNFLWTLLMAVPFRLGLDPVAFSQAIGLLLFPGTLLLTDRIAVAATGSRAVGLLAVILLGTHYTFSAYATGGLETQLHAFLLQGVLALAIGGRDPVDPSPRAAAGLSLLAAGALMTRMDSAIPLVLVYAWLAWRVLRPRAGEPDRPIRRLVWLVVPGAVAVLAWLGWKLAYYGDVYPNTYYAKLVPVSEVAGRGLEYVWIFVRQYALWAVLPVALLGVGRMRARGDRALGLLVALVLAGFGYAIRVGGDFMEFRLLVPVLPALFVLIAWLLVRVCRWPALSLVVAAVLIGASFHHARTFVIERGIESVGLLEGHLYDPDRAWVRIGEVLGELFGDTDDPPRIAVTAAGAIPFHARLPATDMHGITEPWVARHGLRTDPELTNPGHHRRAPFGYLADQGVNLVIGHPWVDERRPGPRPAFGRHGLIKFGIVDAPDRESLPEDAIMRVLEIDLDESHRVYVLYLVRHPHVDAVIAEHELRRHRVHVRRRAD